MYVNNKYSYTNTPMNVTAGYNTWPYMAPKSDWNQHVPTAYIDQYGREQQWNSWNPPRVVPAQMPNLTYHGTSTRTGSYVTNNGAIQR